MPQRVLFLYTELAPYVLACIERLAKEHDVEAHIVRWALNKEAPFDLAFDSRTKVYDRDRYDPRALLGLATTIDPSAVFTSGWVDKGYLKVCRHFRALRRPVVMCSDTAWRGDLRQETAVFLAKFWLRRTFSHAWVTGGPQAIYARKLGFRTSRIRKGFYSADVDRFAPLYDRFLPEKHQAFPHRFLCVARYIPSKGHQDLCDAFDELCRTDKAGDWELWIAGTGELHDQVMRSPSGSNPRIRHLGFVQVGDMPEVMRQCGVFVLPSTYEPWGVVVHEHACAGFPMVLSDRVGAAELFLAEGENGMRFRAGDLEGLGIALRWIVTRHDEDLLRMGGRSAFIGRTWDPSRWAKVAADIINHRDG